MYLSISPSTYLSTYLSICLSVCQSVYLSIYRSIDLSISLSLYLSISLSLSLSVSLSVYLSVYLSIYLSTHLSIYLFIYLSTYLPIYLSISLSLIYLSIDRSIHRSIYLPVDLQAWKHNYSARRPQVLNLTASKTQQVCETFSMFELDNVKNEAILRDFLSFVIDSIKNTASVPKTKQFCETSSFFKVDNIKNAASVRDFLNVWTWQRQKRSNSARLLHSSKLTTSKTKQFCETSSIFKLNNVKNETILRGFLQKWKVECSADGLVPMRFAIFPLHLSKVLRTAPTSKNWCQFIRSAAPVTQNHLSKRTDLMLQNANPLRKSAPWPPNLSHEHVFCTAPATRHASLQILFKCPMPAIVFGNATKPSCFAHFWQDPQSRAPATRNDIWASKSGPNLCVFNILTSKCASRHNPVHFFDIATSKSVQS